MDIIRSQHFTDTIVAARRRRRIISNWANYKEPGRDWQASEVSVSAAQRIPDNWMGNFDFRYQSLKGPIQCFAGDSTDPINTALVGVRSANRPDIWLNIKALGVSAVQPVIDAVNLRIAWPLLWNNTDLAYDVGRHKLDKKIRLRAPGHPSAFRFALRLPSKCTLDIVEGTSGYLRILDETGTEILKSHPAYGWDSSTVAPTPTGTQPIRVDLLRGDNITVAGKSYPTIWLRPNGDDLAIAVYPVIVDPTMTISGTSSIEDNWIDEQNASNNHGGGSYLQLGGYAAWRALIRPSTSAIPSGDITAARLYLNHYAGGAGVTKYIHTARIAAANTWVEGTANGAGQAGSSCWSYARNDAQAWAGSAGCATATTDYENVLTTTEIAHLGWTTIETPAAHFTAWRDGTWVNNGLRVNIGAGEWWHMYSTESATNPLYFELDYTPAAAGNPLLFFKMI